MNRLTTERLEKFVNDIKTDGMCDITDSQVESALIRLFAYEQAAKNEVALPEALKYAEIYGRAFICVDRNGSVHAVDPSQITLTILNEPANAQPVIPIRLVQAINRLLDNDGSRGCFDALEQHIAKTELERLLAAAQQNEPQNIPENIPAQPVSKPYKLPSGWKLVPLEPTAAMFHAFNDCDYGRKSMRERYIQMIEAAPAQESE